MESSGDAVVCHNGSRGGADSQDSYATAGAQYHGPHGHVYMLPFRPQKEVWSHSRPALLYHIFTYVGDYRYFATGALDGVVGIWDAHEMVCVRALNKLEYVPVAVRRSRRRKT